MASSRDIRLLLQEVNRALGVEGKVYCGEEAKEFERIPTGLLAFDTVTGGGLVKSHYLELYGEESAGKTLLALQIVAACQRQGLRCGWVKGEEFNETWAVKQGVNLKDLIQIEALTGDKMLETSVTLIESGLLDALVLDSVQAIGTVREQQAGVESEAYAGGGAPQMWGRMYRRTRSAFNGGKAQTAIIGISQVRANIGGFSPSGKPEPMPTQIHVIKHWKSISIQCKKGEITYEDLRKESRRIVSREFKMRCVKNKTAPPERVSSYRYNFLGEHQGVDYVEEAVRLGKAYGVLEQKGPVLQGYGIVCKTSKKDGTSAQEDFVEELWKHPEALEALRADVLEKAK